MPYTCGTSVKAPCLARVLKITMVMSFAQKLTAMASTEEGAQQMCKHTRSSNNCRQLLADSFGCGQKVWRPLCHGSWTMKQFGYGSAGLHAHDEKKDDGPQVAEVEQKVAEFAARQGQSQPSEESSKRQRLEVFLHRKLRSFCCVSRQGQPGAGRVSVRGWRSCNIVNLSQSGSSIVLRFSLIESVVLPFFLSLSIVFLSLYYRFSWVYPLYYHFSWVYPLYYRFSWGALLALRHPVVEPTTLAKKIIKAETFMRLIHRGATSWISRL